MFGRAWLGEGSATRKWPNLPNPRPHLAHATSSLGRDALVFDMAVAAP